MEESDPGLFDNKSLSYSENSYDQWKRVLVPSETGCCKKNDSLNDDISQFLEAQKEILPSPMPTTGKDGKQADCKCGPNCKCCECRTAEGDTFTCCCSDFVDSSACCMTVKSSCCKTSAFEKDCTYKKIEENGIVVVNFDQLSSVSFDEIKNTTKEGNISKPKNVSKIFIMKRGLFRDLSAFYKHHFSKYVTRWNNLRCDFSEKNKRMEEYILDYTLKAHSMYFMKLTEDQKSEFITKLKEILFSNRYKKPDTFLKGCDFEIIRKLLYSFNVPLRNKFLSCPHNGYLMNTYLEEKRPELSEKLAKNDIELQTELEKELNVIDHKISETLL